MHQLFLARRVKGPLWAQAEADPERWKCPKFPFELLVDLTDKDGSGISVWEVTSEADPALARIAAALMAGTKSNQGRDIQSVDFRLVKKDEVEKLGIVIRVSPGETSDAGINGLHRELVGIDSTQAVGLLGLLSKMQSVFSAKEIARFISRGLVHENLPSSILNKDFLWSLHKQGAVKIVELED